MESIKEQCLRMMLWLATQGLSLPVIRAVQNMLESGVVDSALIRYFFAGMLEIVQAPLSLPFVRAFGGLMMKRPCVDALKSSHFEHSKRAKIVWLIDQFEFADSTNGVSWEEDESLLSTLKSTYC